MQSRTGLPGHYRREILARFRPLSGVHFLGAGLLVFALLISAAGFVPRPSLEHAPPNPTPTARAVAAVSPAVPTPAPTAQPNTGQGGGVSPSPTARPAPAYAPCETECLVRLPSTRAALAVLSDHGVTPAYDGGEFLWTLLPDELMEAFAEADIPVRILKRSATTVPLFSARVPAGADESPVRDLGTILDKLDDQFVVSVDDMPPYLLNLADLGIAVEKFPPPGVVVTEHKPGLGDPWIPAESVSSEQIEKTILEMQGIGGDGGLGTRHYSMPGNVEAADYLFKRLVDYGLAVHYEDFIADHGRLAMNVVGEIPGQDPSKIYLLSAHFDSIASDKTDQSVAPGALDNATGVATLLETARVLTEFQLPHPVHIVFFDVEEVGLQGSTAFADRASREERPYVAGMNIDSVGAVLPSNQLFVNATGDSGFIQDQLVAINDANGGLGIELLPRQNPKIKADEARLNAAGIPTVLLAAVLFGDPMINRSGDTIDQVDPFRVMRVTQLVVLALGSMLIGDVG
jgi:hypothetical protein